mgnify:FL=1
MISSQNELLNNLEAERSERPLSKVLEEIYQALKANIYLNIMNTNVNIHEYVEQLGCHNCENCKKDFLPRKIRCKLDNIEVVPWGKCNKWREKGVKCECSELSLEKESISPGSLARDCSLCGKRRRHEVAKIEDTPIKGDISLRDGYEFSLCPRCNVKRRVIDGKIKPHWVFDRGFATHPCE